MSKTLKLTLKKQWFDLIKEGMKPFEAVEFTNGYNSKSPKITLIIDAIFIGEGKEEWGAVKGQRYFVVKLGREVARQNC